MIFVIICVFIFVALFFLFKPPSGKSSSSSQFTNRQPYDHDKWLAEKKVATAAKATKLRESFNQGFPSAKNDLYAKYIFIDFETTDLPFDFTIPTNDFIESYPYAVQAAILIFNNDRELIAEFSSVIKPPIHARFAPEAVNIHKIDKEKAQNEGVDISLMFSFIKDHITPSTTLIAHNVKFDDFILRLEAKRNKFKLPRLRKYCTMKETTEICALYKDYGNSYKYPKLKELVFHTYTGGETCNLGLNFHDALTDIKLCAMCFFELKLYEDYKFKKG